MISSFISGRYVLFSLWLVLASVCGEDATCDKWGSIAKMMTGDGELHSCFSNKTQVCTRFDCEGSLFEKFMFHAFEVDYCFGIQVNSCLEPLSMDFYLNIPSHNFSHQYRITHDQIVYLPIDEGFFQQLKDLPLVKELHMKPLLDFEFERDGKDNVLISITLKVRSSLNPLLFDQFTKEIVSEEELPIQHCDTLTNDTSKQPAKDFMSLPCHADKYPTMQPRVARPAHNVTPSDTLNKTCDFYKACSQGETCEMTSDTEGVCRCEPDYLYDASQESCVSQGSVGLDCFTDADCGVYEICDKDDTDTGGSSSTHKSCQCEESFLWNAKRKLCILDTTNAHRHSSSKGTIPDHHTSTDHTNSSSSSNSNHAGGDDDDGDDKASHHSDTSGASTKYMVIGGAAAGVAILVAVVVASLIVCRRRRLRRYPDVGGSLYDSHSPMLADHDDDVDLIM